jgi:hypothetical protein
MAACTPRPAPTAGTTPARAMSRSPTPRKRRLATPGRTATRGAVDGIGARAGYRAGDWLAGSPKTAADAEPTQDLPTPTPFGRSLVHATGAGLGGLGGAVVGEQAGPIPGPGSGRGEVTLRPAPVALLPFPGADDGSRLRFRLLGLPMRNAGLLGRPELLLDATGLLCFHRRHCRPWTVSYPRRRTMVRVPCASPTAGIVMVSRRHSRPSRLA